MARAVGSGDAGTVEAEHDRQAVERDVVDDLIPAAVEERAVEGDDRAQAAHRHAGGAGDGVLLGDADVEEAVGEARLEREQPGRARHRGGDRDHALVQLRLLDHRVGEGLRVAVRHSRRRADERVEHGGVVEVLLVVVLGRRVAAALLRHHVHEDRPLRGELDRVAERRLQFGDVVAVDRADVADAERLEERRRLEELAHGGLQRLDALLRLLADVRQVAQEVLQPALAADVHRVEPDVRQGVCEPLGDPRRQARMVGDRAVARRHRCREVRDRRRVRAAVVVEDDDHATARVADVVERLVGHAARHRAIADDRDDVAPRIGSCVPGDRQAVRVRQHGARVAVLDQVVLALLAARVPREAVRLAQLLEPALAAGDDLVHVGLVAGVPEDRVERRLEDAVEGERQLDGAEVRAEMAALLGDGSHDEVPDLTAEVLALLVRELPQVRWLADVVEGHRHKGTGAAGGRGGRARPPPERDVSAVRRAAPTRIRLPAPRPRRRCRGCSGCRSRRR
jgi:hypothetical protein